MKTAIYILSIAQFLVNCQPAKPAYNAKVDQKAGYKDIKLDQPLAAFKKLEMYQDVNNQCTLSKTFLIPNGEYLNIGNIRLDKVDLEFINDSLYRTTLTQSSDYSNELNLLEAYRSEFGEPTREGKRKYLDYEHTVYEWDGKDYYIHIDQEAAQGLKIEYGSFRGLRRATDEWIKCEDRK